MIGPIANLPPIRRSGNLTQPQKKLDWNRLEKTLKELDDFQPTTAEGAFLKSIVAELALHLRERAC